MAEFEADMAARSKEIENEKLYQEKRLIEKR